MCIMFQIDWDIEMDDAWNIAISSFNPYQCDLAPLEVISSGQLQLKVSRERTLGVTLIMKDAIGGRGHWGSL